MQDQANELMQVARERADETLDKAIGELRKAARDIATRYEIPENINGLSVDDLLGRMAWIPTMARDLRRVAGQELAKRGIAKQMAATNPDPAPASIASEISQPLPPTPYTPPEPSKIPETVPIGKDISDLSGVTVQAVKALKGAGMHTVGDIVGAPDEWLLKIPGIAEKSLQQIRNAIAKASAQP